MSAVIFQYPKGGLVRLARPPAPFEGRPFGRRGKARRPPKPRERKMAKRSRWLRLYQDILHNRKIKTLPDDLFRFWIECLALASEEDGTLPSVEDIAFACRNTAERCLGAIEALAERCLIDRLGGGLSGYRWRMHDWGDWQYKSDTSTPRVQALRKRLRNVSETAPDTETEAEKSTGTTVALTSLSESIPQTLSVSPKKAQPTAPLRLLPPSEQPELRLVAPPVSEAEPGGRYPAAFEDLWAEYRHYGNANSSKYDAYKRWAKLSVAEKMMAFKGLTGGYLVWLIGERKRRPDFPCQHLSTFLSRRGWEPFLEKQTG